MCILAVGLSASAQTKLPDWPQFRGPNRDDISKETGLLKRWAGKGPTLRWKGKGIGGGYSSVAVAGKHIYTIGNKGRVSQLHVLDRESGKRLWSVDVGAAGGNLGCTPTVDGDRVYTIGQEGDLACVDTKARKVAWKKHLIRDFDGACGGWRYCESPLVDGDKLVCTPGANKAIMVALDKKTGKVLWRATSPFGDATAGYSSIVVSEVGKVRHYVQLSNGGVFGVRASDGKVMWKYEKLGPNTANIPTPIVLKDQVLSVAGYGKGGALLKLSAAGSEISVKEVYFKRELTNKHGGVLVVDGYIYGDFDDKGTPYCADVKTGKVMWKRKHDEGDGSGSAAVTYADGHLYFLYEDGTMALVKASPGGFEQVSFFKVPGISHPAWAHPVVVGGKLYLRGNDALYCYDVKAE